MPVIDSHKDPTLDYDPSVQNARYACTYDPTWQCIRVTLACRSLDDVLNVISKTAAYRVGKLNDADLYWRTFRVWNYARAIPVYTYIDDDARPPFMEWREMITAEWWRVEEAIPEPVWDWHEVRLQLNRLFEVDLIMFVKIMRNRSMNIRKSKSRKGLAKPEFNYFMMLYNEVLDGRKHEG
jgi:hypothetical protein